MSGYGSLAALGSLGLSSTPLIPGNIDLAKRPEVLNSDGTTSTVRSMSFGDDKGREILIPTVSPDGRVLSDEQAIAQFYKTGQHLGIFATPEAATAYAMQLHNDYANGRYSGGKHLMTVNGSPIEFALGHRPSALALLGDLGLKK